jgi:hypothetical protein
MVQHNFPVSDDNDTCFASLHSPHMYFPQELCREVAGAAQRMGISVLLTKCHHNTVTTLSQSVLSNNCVLVSLVLSTEFGIWDTASNKCLVSY